LNVEKLLNLFTVATVFVSLSSRFILFVKSFRLDVNTEHPDKKSIMMYVTTLYEALGKNKEQPTESGDASEIDQVNYPHSFFLLEHGQNRRKAVCRSVFLTTRHCILAILLTSYLTCLNHYLYNKVSLIRTYVFRTLVFISSFV